MELDKQKQLKIKKKVSWNFRIFMVFWEAITIVKRFYIKRRLSHQIVDELKRNEKKENKKLIEERCFRKDIEIHVILQNLKWYITDKNVHDDQAITMNTFY